MSKQKPEQNTINSMYDQIESSDNNAAITLEILMEDYDFSDAYRIGHVPTAPEDEVATDLLNIYLHAVYHNCQESVHLLIQNGTDNEAQSSYYRQLNTHAPQFSMSLKSPLFIDSGNDVCWAVLSNHEDALSSLGKTYDKNGLDLNVNVREAVPYGHMYFKDEVAKKHTPLDLAVMQYVAQRINDERNAQIFKASAEKAIKGLEPLLNKFKEAGVEVSGISMAPRGMDDLKPVAQITEHDIRFLLANEAVGSDSAYFPMSVEAKSNPFMHEEGFQVMSMEDFCCYNRGYFPEDLLFALTGSHSAPKQDLANV